MKGCRRVGKARWVCASPRRVERKVVDLGGISIDFRNIKKILDEGKD